MRFLVLVKASPESEAGVMPSENELTEMGQFNEELVKAGVMLAGEGLHPSSKGVRVKFDRRKRTVIDGPFAETKELVAGFWMWQVKSKEEAIEWLKRAPFDGGTEVELRQVFESEDFGEAFTPELREQEERLRAQSAANSDRITLRKVPTMSCRDLLHEVLRDSRFVRRVISLGEPRRPLPVQCRHC